VDYGTQARIPKQSAYWYRDTIAAHSAVSSRTDAAPAIAGAAA
jgi:beta-glucosidase/6-phospho-beta-glucosidase/beta-galactosidase